MVQALQRILLNSVQDGREQALLLPGVLRPRAHARHAQRRCRLRTQIRRASERVEVVVPSFANDASA